MQEQAQRDNILTYAAITQSPTETRALGARLGRLLRVGQVIALHGDLGAGKTVFTQGIAAGLGITERVTSPTFTLVNEYHTPTQLHFIHSDSYRLGEGATDAAIEAAAFGLEEMLVAEDAIVVIEWAERVAALLPEDYLRIDIAYVAQDESARHINWTALGPQSRILLQDFITA